jgi:hypothetical protein
VIDLDDFLNAIQQVPRCPDCNNLDLPFEEKQYCSTCNGSGSPQILGHLYSEEDWNDFLRLRDGDRPDFGK